MCETTSRRRDQRQDRTIGPEVDDAMRKLARVLLSLEDLWVVAGEASAAFQDLLLCDIPESIRPEVEKMRATANAIDWNTGNHIDALKAESMGHVMLYAGQLTPETSVALLEEVYPAGRSDRPAVEPSPRLPVTLRKWSVALRALALAEDACDEFADSLDDLRPGESHLVRSRDLSEDARSTAYFIRNQFAILESSAPPDILKLGTTASEDRLSHCTLCVEAEA